VVGQDDDGEEGVDVGQTVERRMAGMAEKIVQEDEAKRTQELVRTIPHSLIDVCPPAQSSGTTISSHRISSTFNQSERTGI